MIFSGPDIRTGYMYKTVPNQILHLYLKRWIHRNPRIISMEK